MPRRWLTESGVPHAVIDLDGLRDAWPAPADDPFNQELELRNLASVVANFRAAGIARFVLAGVIEDARDIERYRVALGGGRLFVCRLSASASVLDTRLRARHTHEPGVLAWYLHRAGELGGILHSSGHDDLVLDTSTASVTDLARRVRSAAGW